MENKIFYKKIHNILHKLSFDTNLYSKIIKHVIKPI